MSTIVTASDGTQFDLDNVEQTFGTNGSQISSISVTLNGVTYTQTITYTSGIVSGLSNWVAS